MWSNILNTNHKFKVLIVNHYQIKFIKHEGIFVLLQSNITNLNESLIAIRLFQKATSSVLITKK